MITTTRKDEKVKIKVLRPFFMEGEVVEPGDVIKVKYSFASEMVTADKATFDLEEKVAKPKKKNAGVDVAAEVAAKKKKEDAKAKAEYDAAIKAEAEAK